jgi:hypothetical protein
MDFRSSASFGKRQEYAAIAELLRRGFDVYMTLVDDRGIDCVVRLDRPTGPVYLDIQIKARSRDCNPRNAGTFAAMVVQDPRPNYFFIFYSEQADMYWVVPSLELVREANSVKSGQNKGKYRIMFTNHSKKTGLVSCRPRFREYEKAFGRLEQAEL